MSKRRSRKSSSLIPENLIPTGSTILNCILSDNAFGGYRKGSIVNLIGDSSSGKSLLSFTAFAAVSQLPEFDEYQLYYVYAEAGQSFNVEKLFGKKTAERIILELKDKVGSIAGAVEDYTPSGGSQDLYDALTSLGYREKDLHSAVDNVPKDLPLEEQIRHVLKQIK